MAHTVATVSENQPLQECNLSLNSADLLLESSLGFVESQRNEFDAFEERGKSTQLSRAKKLKRNRD